MSAKHDWASIKAAIKNIEKLGKRFVRLTLKPDGTYRLLFEDPADRAAPKIEVSDWDDVVPQ